MNLAIGILLTLAGGALAGASMLPLKFLRRWEWENAWLVFTLVSLLILPWALAAQVSHLGAVYQSLSPGQFLVPGAFGFGWGIAQVLFGLSVARLGMALGYAVIIGLGAALGTLVPLFVQSRDTVSPAHLALVLIGLAVMLSGIAVAGRAGKLRESAQLASSASSATSGNYAAALGLAILCGVMAPMLNYSFAFGQDIAQAAVRLGNSSAIAAYAVWPVGLFGGLIPNLAYSLYLLSTRRTWNRFRSAPAEFRFPCLMGLLWMGAISVYGIAAIYLGALGTSVGWGLFQIFMIITANVSGLVTGEWSGAPPRARSLLLAGLALLAAATVFLALGNR